MSTPDPKQLLAALDALYAEKTCVALEFESRDSHEMAYLARWSVIETMLKSFFFATACQSLKPKIDEWKQFLDNPTRKIPQPIPMRDFPAERDKAKLPTPAELKTKFGSALNLLELLDPTKRYRRKRNSIAHTAEAFGPKTDYTEYKEKVELATAELRKVFALAKSTKVAQH
jgi:hypothetical protein